MTTCPLCRSKRAKFIDKIKSVNDIQDIGKHGSRITNKQYLILKERFPYKYECMKCHNKYCSSKVSENEIWNVS